MSTNRAKIGKLATGDSGRKRKNEGKKNRKKKYEQITFNEKVHSDGLNLRLNIDYCSISNSQELLKINCWD